MSNNIPSNIQRFLAGKRFAVAGVSRDRNQPANAILRKLRASGYDAVAVNPRATEIEGGACYPDIASVPGQLDGVMIVTPPAEAERVVRDAAARGVRFAWFHRSFGQGSVSERAVRACEELGVTPIVGGCPLMYCTPVDPAHRCLRWLLGLSKRVPA